MGLWATPLALIAGSGCPSLGQGGWEGRAAATGGTIASTPRRDCCSAVAARSVVVVASAGCHEWGDGEGDEGRERGREEVKLAIPGKTTTSVFNDIILKRFYIINIII
jgi:hypothetical protein